MGFEHDTNGCTFPKLIVSGAHPPDAKTPFNAFAAVFARECVFVEENEGWRSR